MNRILTAIIILCAALLTRCSSGPSCLTITPPRINLTGEKTVIERQIIGEYRELEKDAWVISSARTLARGTGRGTAAIGADRELFIAMKIREFHKNKISRYKEKGILGESSEGLIAYRPDKSIEKDPVSKKILFALIKNENDARKTIFKRSLYLLNEKEPKKAEIAAFGMIFADEQRKLAEKNEWVQEKNGRWRRK